MDDDYNFVAWELSHTAPWETVHFAMGFMPTPAPMTPSERYDNASMPRDDKPKQAFRQRKKYIDMVRQVERVQYYGLRSLLCGAIVRDIIQRMRLDSAQSTASKTTTQRNINVHHERWGGGSVAF